MPTDLRRRIEARRRIYLARHGEVSYFDAAGRPYPPAGVPLNPEGVEQARALRDLLRSVPLDRVVATGLPRTQETAEIIVKGRSISIDVREELREVAPGKMADPSNLHFERTFVGALGDGVGGITRESRFLGGETFGSLQDRVLAAFRELAAAPGWKELLIVAHGGTNRVILLQALGADLSNLGRLEQDAGSINVIDVSPDGALLVRLVNFTPSAPLKKGLRATTMEKIFLEHKDAMEADARGRG